LENAVVTGAYERTAIGMFALIVVGSCAASRSNVPTAQDTAEAVLSVALHRSLVDPRDLPDIGLIGDSAEIVVRSTIPSSSFRIGPRALPIVGARKLLLLSESELQARAAKLGDVYFVAVHGLKVVGDDAEFYIGVEVATSPVRPMLCCCSAKVRYSRVDGTWVYRGSTEFLCA
jgi:hypothetical protein